MSTSDPQSGPTNADPTFAGNQSDLPPANSGAGSGTSPSIDSASAIDTSVIDNSVIDNVKHTRTHATFVGLIIGVIILILLLVFILRNLESQQIDLLFGTVNFPLGVSLLIAAVAGALITALIGGARTIQLSRALKKAKKNA